MLKLPVVLALALATSWCAPPPPQLSPEAVTAFHATRVVRTIDIVMDLAIDAHAQKPPLISTDNTRKIVTWCEAALKTIAASPGGWKPSVLSGLDQLEQTIPPAEWAHIEIYVKLLRTVIAEVQT